MGQHGPGSYLLPSATTCVSEMIPKPKPHLLWVDIHQVSVVGVDGVGWLQEPKVGILGLPHFEQNLHLATVQAHKAGGLQDDLSDQKGVGVEG